MRVFRTARIVLVYIFNFSATIAIIFSSSLENSHELNSGNVTFWRCAIRSSEVTSRASRRAPRTCARKLGICFSHLRAPRNAVRPSGSAPCV